MAQTTFLQSFTLRQQTFIFGIVISIWTFWTCDLFLLITAITCYAGCKVAFDKLLSKNEILDPVTIPRLAQTVKQTLTTVYFGIPKTKEYETKYKDTNPKREADQVIELIMRDFVDNWLTMLTSTNEIRDNMEGVLGAVSLSLFSNISNIDQVKAVSKFVNLYRSHLTDFQEARNKFEKQPGYTKRKGGEKISVKKIKDIVHGYKLVGSIHPALKDPNTEQGYLCAVVECLLMELVPDELTSCQSSRVLLVNLLAKSLLYRVIDLVQDPYWLYTMLFRILSDSENQPVSNQPDRIKEESNVQENNAVNEKIVENSENESSKAASFFFNGEDEVGQEMTTDSHEESRDIVQSISTYTEIPEIKITSACERTESYLPPRPNSLPNLVSMPSDHLMFSPTELPEDANRRKSANSVYEEPKSLFEEVSIPMTELAKTPGSSSVYTLYAIESMAWYRTEQRSWILKKVPVKRRYREFITLHERLEKHPLFGKFVKKVRGPQRWGGFPFRTTDEEQVAKRRAFLETYLKIIIQMDDIGSSMAVRDFLAYSGDANIAFVNRSSHTPQIEQVLVRTLSGMFESLRRTFDPNQLCVDVHSIPPPPPADDDDTSTPSQQYKAATVCPTPQKGGTELERSLHQCLNDDPTEDTDISEPEQSSPEFFDPLDCAVMPRVDRNKDQDDEALPVITPVLHLAQQLVIDRDTWIRRQTAVTLMRSLLGRALDRFLSGEVSDLTSEVRCCHYLVLFREAVWPGGQLDEAQREEPSEEEVKEARCHAREALVNFLPGYLRVVLGSDNVSQAAELILDSLQHPTINRHLIYHLIDLLLQLLLPELNIPNLVASQLHLDS